MDIVLLVATLSLVTIGVLFIYSSGVTSTGDSFSREWVRQIIWAAAGLVLLLGVSFLDYSRIRDWVPYIYGATMLVLVGTLLFGRVVNGARSWIGIGELGGQPSEFAKLAVILMLSVYLERRQASVRKFSTFIVALGIAALPMLLVLIQPDLGTALVFLPVFIVIAFLAGIRLSYILFILGAGILMAVLTVVLAWQQFTQGGATPLGRIMSDRSLFLLVLGALVLAGSIGLVGAFALKRRSFIWVTYVVSIGATGLLGAAAALRILTDSQLMRLVIFLDPNIDPRGAGWNIIQSVTAVGSGGIGGKGWLEGTQSHLQYLPEQSTDFIFSILAEEWGFLGVLAILVGYMIIITRGLFVCGKAKDNFAVYTGAGIVTMVFFHAAVNIGMATGIMPITGIPLLFLSYGGSSLWTAMIGIGLLMSIYQHRYRY